MSKKSIIAVLLAASLALSLAACSGGEPAATESGNEAASVTEEGGDKADAAKSEEAVSTDATQDAADESAVTASSSAVSDADTGDTSAETSEKIFSGDDGFTRDSAAPADAPLVDFDLADLEEYKELPEGYESVTIDKAEFFKAEDGRDAIRIFFCFKNIDDIEMPFFLKGYEYYAVQDGNPLEDFVGPIPVEEINELQPVSSGEEITCAHSYMLNSDSPVVFLLTVLNDDATEDIPVAAKVIDVKE